jgi:ABC-type bacteriocin/lantibiotic exporter with double-glycine peptidase domain
MSVWIRISKEIADSIVNVVKWFEEWDLSAVVLKGVRRSLQLDRYSCGVQCTKVILGYFGRCLSIESIERRLGTDEEGTSISAIRQLMKSRGLTTTICVDATIRDVKRAIDSGQPVLVSLSGSKHWAVVYGYSREAVFVADSSITKNLWCRVSKTRFHRQWDRWMMSVREG